MPDLGAYLDWNGAGTLEEWYRQADRGATVSFMIGHRGVSLTLVRDGTVLDAQMVLLVPAGRNNSATEKNGEGGTAAHEQLLIVGQDDLNIQRGDKFKFPATRGRLNYEVVRIETTLVGMVQAFCEEVQ